MLEKRVDKIESKLDGIYLTLIGILASTITTLLVLVLG